MAQEVLILGTEPNDGTGETLRSGGTKINSNFTELYSLIDQDVTIGSSPILDATNFTNLPSGTFIGAADTPSTYVGQAAKLLQVNIGETAEEFIAKGDINLTDFNAIGFTLTSTEITDFQNAVTNNVSVESNTTHTTNTSNPHSVNNTQVGLGNVTDDAQIKKIVISTSNNIPQWDGTTGDLLKDGLSLETTITDTSSAVPTSGAVIDYIKDVRGVTDLTNGLTSVLGIGELGGPLIQDTLINPDGNNFTIGPEHVIFGGEAPASNGIFISSTTEEVYSGINLSTGSFVSYANVIGVDTDVHITNGFQSMLGDSEETISFSGVALAESMSGTINGYDVDTSNVISLSHAGIRIESQTNDYSEVSINLNDGFCNYYSGENLPMQYSADYSANYTNRSLVDKEYVDNSGQWASDTNGINYQSGNIGIGNDSDSDAGLKVTSSDNYTSLFINDNGGMGVRSIITGTASNAVGVYGFNNVSTGTQYGGFFAAPVSSTGYGVYGIGGLGGGYFETSGLYSNTWGVKGYNVESGTASIGVFGEVTGGGENSKGVYGLNGSSTTSTHYGGYFTADSGDNGIGVYASGGLHDFQASGSGVISLKDAGTVDTPDSGYNNLYAKNNTLYFKDDTGAESDLISDNKNIVVKYSDYTLTTSDYTVLANADFGPVTITLPEVSIAANKIYNIKCIGATYLCSISTNASEEIDGDPSNLTLSYWESITLHSNGFVWYII